MKLIPRGPKIGPNDGFTTQNDIFGYKDFGESLCHLLTNSEAPLVVLLDGEWGSGKSTFVKQISGELRKQTVPVIEFDAFANDYHDDAFIALAGEIYDLGKTVLGSKTPTKNFLASAKKVGATLAPIAARIAIRAASATLVSLDDIKEAGSAATAATQATTDEISKRLETVISERLERRDVERQTLASFRSTLAELAASLSQKLNSQSADSTKPLVVVVDELDRCRPHFTLNLLESVKHLFSVERVVFLLVTDFQQLQEVVRASYGAGSNFNARSYLEKFFHVRATLPNIDERHTSKVAKYIAYLWKDMELNSGESRYDEMMRDGLTMFADQHDLSLRTIERIVASVCLVYAATTPRTYRVAPIVYGLCLLRHMQPSLYRKAKLGQLKWEELDAVLKITFLPDEHIREWQTHWWKYFTLNVLPKEEWVDQLGRSLWQYNLGRERVIPYLCGVIDSMKTAG